MRVHLSYVETTLEGLVPFISLRLCPNIFLFRFAVGGQDGDAPRNVFLSQVLVLYRRKRQATSTPPCLLLVTDFSLTITGQSPGNGFWSLEKAKHLHRARGSSSCSFHHRQQGQEPLSSAGVWIYPTSASLSQCQFKLHNETKESFSGHRRCRAQVPFS